VASSEEVVRPFIAACETRNLKLVAVAVSSLQKLISRAAISMVSVSVSVSAITSAPDLPLTPLLMLLTSRKR
jgi:hypothetical protein